MTGKSAGEKGGLFTMKEADMDKEESFEKYLFICLFIYFAFKDI